MDGFDLVDMGRSITLASNNGLTFNGTSWCKDYPLSNNEMQNPEEYAYNPSTGLYEWVSSNRISNPRLRITFPSLTTNTSDSRPTTNMLIPQFGLLLDIAFNAGASVISTPLNFPSGYGTIPPVYEVDEINKTLKITQANNSNPSSVTLTRVTELQPVMETEPNTAYLQDGYFAMSDLPPAPFTNTADFPIIQLDETRIFGYQKEKFEKERKRETGANQYRLRTKLTFTPDYLSPREE